MRAITKDDAKRMTNEQLVDYMWDKLDLAIFGSWAGVALGLGATVWRWLPDVPSTRAWYDEPVPAHDVWLNWLWLSLLLLSIAIIFASTRSWRIALSELKRRRSEKLDEHLGYKKPDDTPLHQKAPGPVESTTWTGRGC